MQGVITARTSTYIELDLAQVQRLVEAFKIYYPNTARPKPRGSWQRATEDDAPVHIWYDRMTREAVVPGSNSWSDWCLNFDIRLNAKGWHSGFHRAAHEISPRMSACCQAGIRTFYAHSLGAAVCTRIAGTTWSQEYANDLVFLCVATPYVCSEARAKIIGDEMRRGERPLAIHILADDDLVTRVPPWMHRPGISIRLPSALGAFDHSIERYDERMWDAIRQKFGPIADRSLPPKVQLPLTEYEIHL